MRIIVWNVRGFNYHLKQKNVVGRICKLNVDLVCLLETRIKEHKMQVNNNRLFLGWHLFHNYSTAYNGRIWMLWKGNMKVKLVDDTNQSITCKGLYGLSELLLKCNLWSK